MVKMSVEILEGLGGVGRFVGKHKKPALVMSGLLMIGGFVGLGGGDVNIVSVDQTDNDETIPGLVVESSSREPTRTTAVEPEADGIISFDGVRYARIPSNNFPPGCSTTQITRYLMTAKQLENWRLKPGDNVYMGRGEGRANKKLAWWCGPNGQRVMR